MAQSVTVTHDCFGTSWKNVPWALQRSTLCNLCQMHLTLRECSINTAKHQLAQQVNRCNCDSSWPAGKPPIGERCRPAVHGTVAVVTQWTGSAMV